MKTQSTPRPWPFRSYAGIIQSGNSRDLAGTRAVVHALRRALVASVCVVLIAIALIEPRPAVGQAADTSPRRLHVLFLGDDGHHEPPLRVRQILPYLASQGIHATYTDRLTALTPENLAQYDVLAIYANHNYLSPERERALLNFVADGGGLVPIHCASAMFGNSDAYINLVGGAFKGHGTGTFTTERVDADHPAIRGVPAFESWDETYVHMKQNPDRHVLEVRVDGALREPWTWVREHGDGRVFYTAWGHDERTWGMPGFQQLVAQGIRWAAGDWALEADLAPPELAYAESDATLPYYPEGEGWGVTGDPITRIQVPLSPEESLEQAVLRPGFRMELFAAEPDVINPIDMAWDERGRLWVVETVDYPNTFAPDRKGNDRVKILEDTDGDGRADAITVFADQLNIPTSLTLVRGGVIVAQAPDMLFLKDTNGDDRADVIDTLFTGWGTHDTHAGPSNLRYGFDNQIWGAVGYAGFDGVVGGDSVRIPQGFYRFTPDGSRLEDLATTNNNTWGLGFSEEGLVFGSTANRNPSMFLPIPKRYYERLRGEQPQPQRRRRGFSERAPVLPPIADTSLFYPVATEVYQVDHHGRYTSGAAHELYTARAFPPEYWNRAAFVGGPTGHLLGMFFLEPDGSSFGASNEWSLVASRDGWFAPIQARVGPDGALWMIDWYSPVIQHNPTPPGFETGEGNAYESELRDKQYSRIYRIVHRDARAETRPTSLADATPEDLVRTLRDDNMHWRLMAQRLLVERGESDVLPMLYRLVENVRVDELGLNPAAIHALWTMHGLGALDGSNEEALAVARAALHHPTQGVRRAALMVLPPTAETLEAIRGAGLLPDRTAPDGVDYVVGSGSMTAAEPQVRLATLLALADIPAADGVGRAVAELLLAPANANDRWIRDAATIAGTLHGEEFLRRLLVRIPPRADSTYRANIRYAVSTATAHHAAVGPADFLVSIVTDLDLNETDPALADAFLEALAANWPEGSPPDLTGAQREATRALAADAPAPLRAKLKLVAVRWGDAEMAGWLE